ncbi:MAG TPA: 50S ribosomal protein L25/general stress protein Ctc [Galbitalea sp.]|jgi:large subunit ribosomal protein L25|nr:50S ribosomal protein L25/general stress protein Ctc [Galbitalea sp.]
MADDNKLVAEVRTTFGKGAARRIRATGKIPAVIYGHGTSPQHVTLPNHEVSLILRKANAVLDLDINGKSQLALVKDVQKDPVKQIIEHIDLVIVRKGEKVTIDIPVHLEGEALPGTQVLQDANTLSIEAEATNIPERLIVSIEGLGEGTHITAAQVTLPEGSTLISDPELLVVGITSATVADLGETAEEEAEGEAAEGEAEAASEDAPAAEEPAE